MSWIPNSIRWIQDEPRPGALHMALDEWFAQQATPVFRVYDWLPSTVSLGFHQQASRFNFETADALGLGICRRPTGGRAVVHDGVFTYSVVMPLNANLQPSLWELYEWVGSLWVETLANCGFRSETVAEPVTRPGARFDGCFASGNRFELTAGGKKLLGSAQRRYPGSALQHGSLRVERPCIKAAELFFDRNPAEPDEDEVATSLHESYGKSISFIELAEALKATFSKQCEVHVQPLVQQEITAAMEVQSRFVVLPEAIGVTL